VTNSKGNLQMIMTYNPFGGVHSGASNGIRYAFTSKEQDAIRLYCFGTRFYDPKVGNLSEPHEKTKQIPWCVVSLESDVNEVIE